jgi:fermentation-respiration switch protein FrsA (DUF1100 family)
MQAVNAINRREDRQPEQAVHTGAGAGMQLQELIATGKSMIAILLGTVLLLPAVLYTMQDGLLFFPPPPAAAAPRAAYVEAVKVPVGDGLLLSGWLVRSSVPLAGERTPLVIYFGGNAEEVSYTAGSAANMGASWPMLAVNYRGYGGNPGTPGERALFADALALYDWAAARPDIDPARIVLMGRSLGSGVAVHVASQRKPLGVVLVTPYDSIRDVAQSMYPTVPVGPLLRHPFDSLARAPAIHAPMLALVAEKDQVIPPIHARRLFEAWLGPKQWHQIAAVDHDSISSAADYWTSIRDFLAAQVRPLSEGRS